LNIDELQRHWQRLDDKVERSLRIQTKVVHQVALQPIRRRMARHLIWPIIDISFSLLVVLFSGSMIVKHLNQWLLLMMCGMVLFPAIILIIDNLRRVIRVANLNWGASLIEIQQSLLQLQVTQIRQMKWIILLSPLVGFCGFMLTLQWLLDQLSEPQFILEKLNFTWLVANLVFGLLFILVGHQLVRLAGNRFQHREWWQHAVSSLSGKALESSRKELDRWATLSQEPQGGLG
jgi:hypothetical protein